MKVRKKHHYSARSYVQQHALQL